MFQFMRLTLAILGALLLLLLGGGFIMSITQWERYSNRYRLMTSGEATRSTTERELRTTDRFTGVAAGSQYAVEAAID